MTRWLPVLAVAVAIALYLPGTWRVPFADVPEPLEALVVWEMVDTGDWVLPRRNGIEIPAKPPFYHWIAATLSTLAGEVDEFTVRLPSVLFGALSVGIVAWVAAAEWGVVSGVVSALALITCPEWTRWAVTARTDATFAFFVTASLVLGDRWLRAGGTARLLATSAAAAGAVLAKGPAGVLLPALVLAVEVWRRGTWSRLRAQALVPAGALFLVISGSWYAAALAHGGGDFLHKQILVENLLRFFPSEEGGPSREHSLFFYVPALLIGMAPWSLALPAAIRSAWRDRRTRERMETLTGHLLSWVAVVFVVCSIASGKRTNYILPLYPAAAMLVGRYVASWLEQGANGGRALRITGIVSAGALSLLAVVLALWRAGQQPWTLVLPWLHPRDREVLPAVVSLLGPPPLAILLGVASLAGALLVAVFFRASRTVAALLGLVLLFATLAGTAVARPVEGRWKSFEPFAARVASRVSPGDPLYFFRKPQYALLFYLRRHVPVESRRFDAIPTSAWALVWEEDWNRLDGSKRRRGEIVEVSRPVAPHRPDSRLLLVRFLPEPAGG